MHGVAWLFLWLNSEMFTLRAVPKRLPAWVRVILLRHWWLGTALMPIVPKGSLWESVEEAAEAEVANLDSPGKQLLKEV